MIVAVVEPHASVLCPGLPLRVVVLLHVALVPLLMQLERSIYAHVEWHIRMDLLGKVLLVRDLLVNVTDELGTRMHVEVIVLLLDACPRLLIHR